MGRYAQPAKTTIEMAGASVPAAFPEKALEARDLPRRWARARVDDLLRRIELEGEKREWVEEILELSRRYKFVTPYTAFLAIPVFVGCGLVFAGLTDNCLMGMLLMKLPYNRRLYKTKTGGGTCAMG